LLKEFSPPIRYTFLAPNLCISALVFEFKASFCVNNIGEFIADVKVYPGEDEMIALAQGGLRVLTGEEEAQVYDN